MDKLVQLREEVNKTCDEFKKIAMRTDHYFCESSPNEEKYWDRRFRLLRSQTNSIIDEWELGVLVFQISHEEMEKTTSGL
jgi:hypothetical protein